MEGICSRFRASPPDTISGGYTFKSRFEDGPGSNPEQLIAAAHAACFTMALSNMLSKAGSPPDSVQTNATVTLKAVDGSPTFTKIALVTVGRVPGLDEAAFIEHANAAKVGCRSAEPWTSVPRSLSRASCSRSDVVAQSAGVAVSAPGAEHVPAARRWIFRVFDNRWPLTRTWPRLQVRHEPTRTGRQIEAHAEVPEATVSASKNDDVRARAFDEAATIAPAVQVGRNRREHPYCFFERQHAMAPHRLLDHVHRVVEVGGEVELRRRHRWRRSWCDRCGTPRR